MRPQSRDPKSRMSRVRQLTINFIKLRFALAKYKMCELQCFRKSNCTVAAELGSTRLLSAVFDVADTDGNVSSVFYFLEILIHINLLKYSSANKRNTETDPH